MRRHDLTKKYLPTYIPTYLPTYVPGTLYPIREQLLFRFSSSAELTFLHFLLIQRATACYLTNQLHPEIHISSKYLLISPVATLWATTTNLLADNQNLLLQALAGIQRHRRKQKVPALPSTWSTPSRHPTLSTPPDPWCAQPQLSSLSPNPTPPLQNIVCPPEIFFTWQIFLNNLPKILGLPNF